MFIVLSVLLSFSCTVSGGDKGCIKKVEPLLFDNKFIDKVSQLIPDSTTCPASDQQPFRCYIEKTKHQHCSPIEQYVLFPSVSDDDRWLCGERKRMERVSEQPASRVLEESARRLGWNIAYPDKKVKKILDHVLVPECAIFRDPIDTEIDFEEQIASRLNHFSNIKPVDIEHENRFVRLSNNHKNVGLGTVFENFESKRLEKLMKMKESENSKTEEFSFDWPRAPTKVAILGDLVYLAVPGHKGRGQLLTAIMPQSSTTEISPKRLNVDLYSPVDMTSDPSHHYFWILDSGVVNTLYSPIRLAPPRILLLNSTLNKISNTVDLSALVKDGSSLQFLSALIEPTEKTKSATLFVTDGGTGSIIVWDMAHDKGHRVLLPSSAIPSGGVLSSALLTSPSHQGGVLYLASTERDGMFRVRTSSLTGGKGGVQRVIRMPPSVIIGSDGHSRIYLRRKNHPEVREYNTITKRFKTVHRPTDGLLPTQCCSAYSTSPLEPKNSIWLVKSNFPEYSDSYNATFSARVCLKRLVNAT